eukprot:6400474-Pyramimonas_sp.AAC.1
MNSWVSSVSALSAATHNTHVPRRSSNNSGSGAGSQGIHTTEYRWSWSAGGAGVRDADSIPCGLRQ